MLGIILLYNTLSTDHNCECNMLTNLSGNGCHGNRWSMATFRVALSIYNRSPAAYEAFKSWEIFNLPSRSTLKQYSTTLHHNEGTYYDYIEHQRQLYDDFTKQHEKEGFKKPLGEGVLILDEVKVISKVGWNCKDGKLLGLAMETSQIPFLGDISKDILDEDSRRPAEYMLQFLWRDLTSSYDIIGPHYSSTTSMDAAFTEACLQDAMYAFQQSGFKVRALVMDGASSNLSMIKSLAGYPKGAFGMRDDADPYAVVPRFENPLFEGEHVYMIICPTHEMKNLINQLWASQPSGAKSFKTGDGVGFGWPVIEAMWMREKEKRDNHQIRMVPALIYSFIKRDPWTKLNVPPAKIMQQEQVLSELYSHAQPDTGRAPTDATSALACHAYLTAVHKIFERGLLASSKTKMKVDALDCSILQNIDEGFAYFKTWHQTLTDTHDDFKSTAPQEKRFIAWQTFDLLRICVYGFKMFCQEFLNDNPGYHIMPLMLNGSAVETLFSQMKFNANGKLCSTNYSAAKRAVMLKKDIHGPRTGGHGYRNENLHIPKLPLRRKDTRRSIQYEF